jgi:hypothetical protein
MVEQRSGPLDGGKYARVERERRFLLAESPEPAHVTATRLITDRYFVGTRLRLRRAEHTGTGMVEYKLAQKVPLEVSSAVRPLGLQGLITNTYLSRREYDLLLGLPGATLVKTRFSVPMLGVDVFDGPLRGLVLAEAEFGSDDEAAAFPVPPVAVAEVTRDQRFTGGRLASATATEVRSWLLEFGLGVPE